MAVRISFAQHHRRNETTDAFNRGAEHAPVLCTGSARQKLFSRAHAVKLCSELLGILNFKVILNKIFDSFV